MDKYCFSQCCVKYVGVVKESEVRRALKYIFCIVTVIVIAIVTTIPCVVSIESFYLKDGIDGILEECSDLYEKYQQLADERDGVISGDKVEVVTVCNLWGSCKYYVLPCYILDVRNVLAIGSVKWTTAICFLVSCTNENCTAARFCSWQVLDLNVQIEPGMNTYLYTFADISPLDLQVGHTESINIEEKIDCIKVPEIQVIYTIATCNNDLEQSTTEKVKLTWNYSLYCCGKKVCDNKNFSLICNYLVNTNEQ